ncbi:long-chain-fatty-acid--CoA ligase [Rhodococcus sp. G-MC3]|uniref:long-chain-fatty-acid--CoA ligase n=1 Tax=Rhodococcus sp. G-MC3 TaxID=3046209 RepID=UPI0024B91420|nr:long-chain-fatty-acid--CoA ligase [Rhodococcus sp. G-MC3]MDJ0395313.1 long-chain-fatty-acid--CoA ligase [Rhodococcus sp. G-MC3]
MPTITDLLRARSDDTDTALLFEDQRISWAEHVRISLSWAGRIRAMLDPGKPPHVGILLDNVPEFSYLLGAAALGGFVAVGLNSTRSGPELREDARRTHCQVVFTDAAHRHLVDGLDVNDFGVNGVDVNGVDSFEGTDPLELFALVFTSGTSGDPKAVRCTHSKVVTPGIMLGDRFGLGCSDTVYVSMPLFHSNAIMAGWAVALASGANLALRRTFSASGFLPDVRRFGATYANYVGTPLSYVLATPELPDDSDNPLRVVYGNEATPGAATEFARRFDVHVVDGFGSSEGGVSIARTPHTPAGALGPLPEGTAILDPDGRECVVGIVGELVNTAGAGMFCGYYDNEAADADRMRDGMYFTGDLAYRDTDGYAYFAGRTAGWMRVDGENLAAAPIERILLRHPAVEAACVYGIPSDGPGDRIMAALLAPGIEMTEFANFLAAQPDLSLRARPRFVRLCTALPRTATHKILARELQSQNWRTDDPVWWSPSPVGAYVPFDKASRQGSVEQGG